VAYILKTYKDAVRVNFKPLPSFDHSPLVVPGASYADCAGKQGKFMDYAALLLKAREVGAGKEKPGEFTAFAAQLKLDIPALEHARPNLRPRRRVTLDVAEGDLGE